MPQGPPRRRRARPVADAPVDALLLRAEDLAKGWLLALLEQAPLHDAPAILAGDLSRDGPRLCDGVVRALADDADLRRLEEGGALEPLVAQAGSVTGVPDPPAASQAVDALHAVIWSALRSELDDPEGEQVSELAERLSLVIEHVRRAALRASAGSGARRLQGSMAPSVPPAEPVAPGGRETAPADGRRADLRVAPAAAPAPPSDPAPAPPAPAPAPPAPAPPAPAGPAERDHAPWAVSSGADGIDALWKGALYDEVERAAHSGAPLSLLVVELSEADRLMAVEGRSGAGVTLSRFARAVRSVVRRGDILACESDTRAWIIATNTGRLGAQALADRVAAAVRAAEPWRGAPLGVSAGLAVFREDGVDVADLIDAAEEARFAAEASGVAVIRADDARRRDLEPEVDPAV